MKQDFPDDVEAAGQWTAVPHDWSASSQAAHVAPQPQVSPVRWLRGSRSYHARRPDAPLAVRADDAALDEHCRATLQKLVAAGCTRANEPCSIEQFQVAEQELHHLKQHGFVHAEGSALLQPVLRSYERLRNGADVGKISVLLNVDLY